jgi:hypothetical protein
MIILRVTDYTKAPGGEYIANGPHSGEWFWQTALQPKIKEAIKAESALIIELDGVMGYPHTWLRGAFSPIGQIKSEQEWRDSALRILFKTKDNEYHIDEIRSHMWKELTTTE